MLGWRGTCAATPASLSEVSAARCPLCAGSCQTPAHHRGCAAPCRQPAGFPRVLSLQSDFALGQAAPRVTRLEPFARQMPRQPRHTRVSLHTPATLWCMLA